MDRPRKEELKDIREIGGVYTADFTKYIDALEKYCNQLEEKQKPQKVLEVSKDEYETSGYKYCYPSCGMLVGTITSDGCLDEDDYCCSCGQRLDWSKHE